MLTNFSASFRKNLNKSLLASASILGLELEDTLSLGSYDKIIEGDFLSLLAGQFIVQFPPGLSLKDG
jgi:hypothetical protein